jgi:O-succinylbenzoic acid--CoA ligase
MTQTNIIERDELSNIVDRYAFMIKKYKNIALYADLSLENIIIILAAIKSGLGLALCNRREPEFVVARWLDDLGINDIINYSDIAINNSHIDKDYSENFLTYLRTSGTTSEPKSALISYVAHRHSAVAVSEYFSFSREKIWCLSLPLYHVSGLSIIFRALVQDAGIFIAGTHEIFVDAITKKHISHCSVVPAQVKRLLAEHVDMSHLDAVIVGGDALCGQDRDEALLRKWPLYETYGMCETASMIAVKKSLDSKTTILPHANIYINNKKEILVKSLSLFSGYYENKNISLKTNKEGYFATGDLAMSEDFDISMISRKNNRIISGGENIQAEEVERVLEQHDHIAECVVVAIKDSYFGQRPLAFIKWQKKALPYEELLAFLKPRLASYKIPVRFLNYPEDVPQSFKKPRRFLEQFCKS